MAPIVGYAHLNPNNRAFSHYFKVSYVEDVQDWMQPSHLFIALFQLYNLASVIKRDRPQHPGMRDCIRSLNQELEAKLKDAYTSERMHETSHTSDDEQVLGPGAEPRSVASRWVVFSSSLDPLVSSSWTSYIHSELHVTRS